MNANTQVIVLGLILALAYVPPNLQIVISLVVGSVVVSHLIGNQKQEQVSVLRNREHGPSEMANDDSTRDAERFDDAKEVLRHLKKALHNFDPHRVEQIACVLDDCIASYLDALSLEPGVTADMHLSSHMVMREDLHGLLVEANTTCDGSVTIVSHLDKAAERMAALFQSFDRVLHLGGYTSRAGPIPVLA